MKKRLLTISLCALLIVVMAAVIAGCTTDSTQFTVTVTGGTITGGASTGTFDKDAECTVTATIPEGKDFSSWTVGETVVSTSSTYKFKVTENISLVANFVNKYTITVEGGTASPASVKEGGSVKITATEPAGQKFVSWKVGATVLSTENPYTFIPTSNMTIVATFEARSAYTVTVTGGIGGGQYYDGYTCSVAANEAGKTFVSWSKDGTVVSTNSVYSFTVTGSASLVANYTDNTAYTTSAKVFSPEAPDPTYGKSIAMDRMVSGGMFSGANFIGGASIDYVLIYIYEKDAAQPVGYFKYYENTVTSLDGTVSYTQTEQWSTAGNYYIYGVAFGPQFLSPLLGNNYGNTQSYYFKNQIIAKVGSSNGNSAVSEFASLDYSEVYGEFWTVTLVNCTADGGRYPDGQSGNVGVYKEKSVTCTATVADGYVLDKWLLNDVEVTGATDVEYTFTPTADCKIEAVTKPA